MSKRSMNNVMKEILAIAPDAVFDEDSNGEIVVSLGMRLMDKDTLVPMNDELGECDACGEQYELASRFGRCGDCGNCSHHCEHNPCETCGNATNRAGEPYCYNCDPSFGEQ
jgi:hypothetical protein